MWAISPHIIIEIPPQGGSYAMVLVNDYDESQPQIEVDTCRYCVGNSCVRKRDGSYMTSKEYCVEVNTCSATIDWDKVYSRD